jgi:hypothetical protein
LGGRHEQDVGKVHVGGGGGNVSDDFSDIIWTKRLHS